MFVDRCDGVRGWRVLNRKRVNSTGRNSTRSLIFRDESVFDLKRSHLALRPTSVQAVWSEWSLKLSKTNHADSLLRKTKKRSTDFFNLDQQSYRKVLVGRNHLWSGSCVSSTVFFRTLMPMRRFERIKPNLEDFTERLTFWLRFLNGVFRSFAEQVFSIFV